jgi:hypothetical protein
LAVKPVWLMLITDCSLYNRPFTQACLPRSAAWHLMT